jgi:hypothetical protein
MSGEKPSTKLSPADDLTNVDLYCLHCGYNLRGLSGDPRRCPECGEFSPLSELTLPAEVIAKQLRGLETWPTACVGLALLLMLVLLISVPILIASGFSGNVVACCSPVLVILGAYWLIGVQEFRSACMSKSGWSQVLFEYHLYGLGLCLMVLVCAGLPLVLIAQTRGPNSSWATVAGVVILIGGFSAVVVLAPRARRRCKAKMDVFQRDVAVKLAAEHLRNRLSRPHS